jgi:hypothetical protein
MKLARYVLASVAGSALAYGSMAADEPPKIYECKDASGNIVYQDDPCIETPPAAAKLPSVAKPKAAAKSTAMEKPTSPAKPKPSAQPKPPAQPKVVTPPEAAALPWVAVIPSSPRSSEPPPPRYPVDARWASPEKTLRTFVDALKSRDRDLVLSCLTPSALADLGADAETVPIEKLRETVGSFTGYVIEGDLGPYWSIRALRAGLRPKWIFFEKTGDGSWKIGAI